VAGGGELGGWPAAATSVGGGDALGATRRAALGGGGAMGGRRLPDNVVDFMWERINFSRLLCFYLFIYLYTWRIEQDLYVH
jgi:hypothetical protein